MTTHKCDCDGRSLGLDRCDKCRTMNTTESRRAFEEAMGDKYNLLRNNEGVYLSIETRAALDGWQAARDRERH